MTPRDLSPELELVTGPAGTTLRVDGADWLTVASSTTAASVEFASTVVDGSIRFTSTATADLRLDPRGFAEPQVIHPAIEPTTTFADAGGQTFGYQHMEFALPARTSERSRSGALAVTAASGDAGCLVHPELRRQRNAARRCVDRPARPVP